MAAVRTHHRRPHVVVAGGGIAGVEALLALRALAGARLSLELVAPGPDLVLRPLAVAEPFGTEEVRRVPLAAVCADLDVHLRADAVDYVDVEAATLETAGGTRIAYDALLAAPGARPRAALPGALTFDGRAGIDGFRALLAALAAGEVRSVAFALPAGATWPLPLYELALMTAAQTAGADVELTLVTPERDPLEALGGAARRRVGALLAEHGIALRTTATPLRIDGGVLRTSGGPVAADRVVALPVLEGPRISGLPADGLGFIPVDDHGAVAGAPGVWAAGDGTTAPLKQGGLAAQQAGAAAAAIAHRLGAPCEPEPFVAVPRAQLLTGALPWFFRGEDESRSPLWWPAGKVAAPHLAPYLAERVRSRLSGEDELGDRPPHGPEDDAERAAALDLALTLADDEADAGEPAQALRWLEAAEAVAGTLPRGYLAKRRRWGRGATDRPAVRTVGGAWG